MNSPDARSTVGHAVGAAHWRRLSESLARIPKVAMISVIGPAVLLVAGYALWVNYGAKHLDRSLYGLHQDNILLTPQPPWIRSNVLKEVFEECQLDRLSVLDHNMAPTIYNAFRLHPWIRQVFNVGKVAGAQVRVNVEYREPLAMVYFEVPAEAEPRKGVGTPQGEQSGKSVSALTPKPSRQGERLMRFLPVDGDGVLLRTEDFKEEQVTDFMLIYAQGAIPSGMIGGEFGDIRIKQALSLCRLLKDVRARWGLERVYVYPDPSSQGPSRWTLELTTKTKKIHWGHAPGMESPGEPGAPAKFRKLEEFLFRPQGSETSAEKIDLVVSAKPNLSKAFGPLP